MIGAAQYVDVPGWGVIATSRRSAPLPAMPMSIVLVFGYLTATAPTAGAARELVTDNDVDESAADAPGSEPGLKPNQRSQRISTPRPTSGIEVARGSPAVGVFVYLPIRGPSSSGPRRHRWREQVDHRRAWRSLHSHVHLQPAAAEDPVLRIGYSIGAEDHRVVM